MVNAIAEAMDTQVFYQIILTLEFSNNERSLKTLLEFNMCVNDNYRIIVIILIL